MSFNGVKWLKGSSVCSVGGFSVVIAESKTTTNMVVIISTFWRHTMDKEKYVSAVNSLVIMIMLAHANLTAENSWNTLQSIPKSDSNFIDNKWKNWLSNWFSTTTANEKIGIQIQQREHWSVYMSKHLPDAQELCITELATRNKIVMPIVADYRLTPISSPLCTLPNTMQSKLAQCPLERNS